MSVSLNEKQLEAVTAPRESALLVVAGPGSGKTRVIAERVKHLLSQGVKPSDMLCLTFSEKAADEMRERIEREAGTAEVETCTFHSFCLRVLDESVLDTGVNYTKGLISKANQLVWGLKNIDTFGFEHIEVGNNAVHVINALIDGISAFRDELVGPQELGAYIEKRLAECEQELERAEAKKPARKGRNASETDDLEDEIEFLHKLSDLQKVYQKYEQYKRRESLIDYDDMIHLVVDVFTRKPGVLRRYQDRYAHVLVDEFQDNNYSQLELVKLLCPSGHVTAVGDDDQSIYRFRGAYYSIFDDFSRHYAGGLKVVKLERNYRSTKNIVGLAKQLLDPVPGRIPKNLYSENEDGARVVVSRCATDLAQVDYVVRKIKELVGQEVTRRDGTVSKLEYRDIAVLSRKRFGGVAIARGIKAHGIPCTFVGESKIFSMPAMRDLLAYLKVAADPLDGGIELARIMLGHGVSEQDVKVINHAARQKARDLVRRAEGDQDSKSSDDMDLNYGTDFVYDVMEQVALGGELSGQVSSPSLIREVYGQVKRIVAERDKKTLSQFVYDLMMSHTDIYRRTLKDESGEARRDRLVLHEFLELVREFESVSKGATVRELLAHVDMMSDFDIELRHGQDETDSVTVTTIHKSKGREFPVVFVVDVAHKRLPMVFREKQFYCPSGLARGKRDRERSEREAFLEEERRLLYVAMTRAQHRLFLTFAEIYGGNTTKTRPSQFLQELDVENNPRVEMAQHDIEVHAPELVPEERIDQVRHEYQALAAKFVSQMQLKSALEKIVELAMLEHVRAGRPIDSFDPSALTGGIQPDRAKIQGLLSGRRPALVDGEMHFSATALEEYEDCPLKYKFHHILAVPSPPKTYFGLGSAVHSTLEALTRRQTEEPGYVPTREDALLTLDHYWTSGAYENVTKEMQDRRDAERMLEFFVKWCEERKAAGCVPVHVEKKFEIDLDGRKVVGYIDRIDRGASGDYQVFDYKTSRTAMSANEARRSIQMNLYSLAVQRLFGQLPSSANLLYLRKEKSVSYGVTGQSVGESREKMNALIKGIMSEDFTPRPDFNTCRRCDYQSICEAKELNEE